jgi:hypothetical protein
MVGERFEGVVDGGMMGGIVEGTVKGAFGVMVMRLSTKSPWLVVYIHSCHIHSCHIHSCHTQLMPYPLIPYPLMALQRREL